MRRSRSRTPRKVKVPIVADKLSKQLGEMSISNHASPNQGTELERTPEEARKLIVSTFLHELPSKDPANFTAHREFPTPEKTRKLIVKRFLNALPSHDPANFAAHRPRKLRLALPEV